MEHLKKEWFGNIKKDILAGIVVAIALIPEAIGFSILAGVDPMMGLNASFCIAIITAFGTDLKVRGIFRKKLAQIRQ